mmetsp:Transcript_64260/g.147960  ORF Transcript_64260/g.147960 Transcript_64260/m.147960 type:complete len:279 (+) Transcript_64260:49-885(+)
MAPRVVATQPQPSSSKPSKRPTPLQQFKRATDPLRNSVRRASTHVIGEASALAAKEFPQGLQLKVEAYPPDAAKDLHDAGNLVALPIVLIFDFVFYMYPSTTTFYAFWFSVLTYFVGDLLWVILIPDSVKSPPVIIVHHISGILYLSVFWYYDSVWHMMALGMTVEINTWFLIARRYWRRSSVLFSVCFYISWAINRVGVFTVGFVISLTYYLEEAFHHLDSNKDGAVTRMELIRLENWFCLMLLAPIFQGIFTLLNWKWTVDLIRSKLRGKGPSRGL